MERIIYIGPDMSFLFGKRREGPIENEFYGTVKVMGVKLSVYISFQCVKSTKENSPTECSMLVKIAGVAGDSITVEALQRAVNCLMINRKIGGEVCCQAFLNGFLDNEF
jgi:DNA-binding transcriptional regulator YdaS (Cro superfamily)